MLYQQLKRDLRHGRLYCSLGESAALGSLIVQEEIGDYDEEICPGNYVSNMVLALRQTDQLERKVMELHKKREPGQDSSVAMDEFMGIARGLETYGIDPHPVKDHRGTQLYIGINHSGISTFMSGRRSQHFRWSEVQKINYEGKMFIAHLCYTDSSREVKKHTIGFKCPSSAACRYVWRCAIEQMLFFTLPNSQNASVVTGGGFFSWGTKFKYTGRTEREILTETINELREQKLTNTGTPGNRKASSVPATPSSPAGDLAQIRKLLRKSYLSADNKFTLYHTGYSSLPRSTMSEPLGHNHMGIGHTTDHMGNIIYGDGYGISNLEPVSEDEALRLRSSNIDSLNNPTTDLNDYYFRDSFEHSSQESGLNPYCETNSRPLQQRHHHNTSKYNKSSNTHTPILNAKTTSNNNINHIHQSTDFSSGSNIPSSTIRSEVCDDSTLSNAAGTGNSSGGGSGCLNGNRSRIRKFRLLHAFIPSFIFVVLAMAVSAIFILESESEIFDRLKNLPEMISLRYQYYQPLKDFLVNKFGRKL
ncbi:FRMD5 family protein [Megaselia abdita]